MFTLRFLFLGSLDIHCDDRLMPKPPTLRSQTLLAYLVLHRQRPQPRDRLVGLFWGDRPERRALRSLSTASWRMRHSLPEQALILSDAQTLQFDRFAVAWLDVRELESHASHIASRRSILARRQPSMPHSITFFPGRGLPQQNVGN